MPVLHYLYDPLCGWCYAAEALIELVQRRLRSTLNLQMHGVGLFPGGELPAIERRHLRSVDMRIAQLTGQTFGPAYLDALLFDDRITHDPQALIAAVLAAEQLEAGIGPEMLLALQRAHYREGRRLDAPHVIAFIAESVGLDRADFDAALAGISAEAVSLHMATTQQWMRAAGVVDLPAFVLQSDEGVRCVSHEPYYATPGRFVYGLLKDIERLSNADGSSRNGYASVRRRPAKTPASAAPTLAPCMTLEIR